MALLAETTLEICLAISVPVILSATLIWGIITWCKARKEKRGKIEVTARYRKERSGPDGRDISHKLHLRVVRSGTLPVTIATAHIKRTTSDETYEITLKFPPGFVFTHGTCWKEIISRPKLLEPFPDTFHADHFPFDAQIILKDSLGKEYKSNVFEIPSDKRETDERARHDRRK